ncbi:outer membrane protein assembly factor BamC [Pseudomonas sp.]|uniref:outer membrane protein assembly factor BamC n=1 Tax=Pseudomonas sp. TaxID=306 RepID=UPI0027310972|nr:outer membrane protein assembly factor BamC [Pseudomonas sp.]MDP2245765.1 outer membrane protein assembly factor BamC [Pseudomonas sp.]
MITLRVAGILLSCVLVTACVGPFRDRALDYRQAQDVAPLVLPAGQEARPVRPLFPVPPETGPVEWPAKFEVPKPRPLPQDAVSGVAAPTPDVKGANKPVMTQDGNGYPVLSIQGEFNAVWDTLDQALRAANVKIDDRDQRLAMYFLSLANTDGKPVIYQLRVTRGQTDYTLALQQNDDTLAPQAVTRTLFESIVSRWP